MDAVSGNDLKRACKLNTEFKKLLASEVTPNTDFFFFFFFSHQCML